MTVQNNNNQQTIQQSPNLNHSHQAFVHKRHLEAQSQQFYPKQIGGYEFVCSTLSPLENNVEFIRAPAVMHQPVAPQRLQVPMTVQPTAGNWILVYPSPTPSPANSPPSSPSLGPVSHNSTPSLGPVSHHSSPCCPPIGRVSQVPTMPKMQLNAPLLGAKRQMMKIPDISDCEYLYSLDIIKHQATVGSVFHQYSKQLADEMKKILGLDQTAHVYVVCTEHETNLRLTWLVIPLGFALSHLQQITKMKDFDKLLISRLAHVGNGEFNKHLHGSKQISIFVEGRGVFNRLFRALESHNQSKASLLASNMIDQFDKENIDHLLHCCDAPKGLALRGPNVVGAHFRGGDVLKMHHFLNVTEAVMGRQITRATMIPSMKGKAQYKGWSIYVETPSGQHVNAIIETCKTCNFEKAEIFTAIDKFNRSA